MSARSREPFVPAEDAIPYKSSVITHEKGTSITDDDKPDLPYTDSPADSPSGQQLTTHREQQIAHLKSCFPQLSENQLAEFLELCQGDETWATNILLDSNKLNLPKPKRSLNSKVLAIPDSIRPRKSSLSKSALVRRFKSFAPVTSCLRGQDPQATVLPVTTSDTMTIELTSSQAHDLHAVFSHTSQLPAIDGDNVRVTVPRWLARRIHRCMITSLTYNNTSMTAADQASYKPTTAMPSTPKRPPRHKRTHISAESQQASTATYQPTTVPTTVPTYTPAVSSVTTVDDATVSGSEASGTITNYDDDWRADLAEWQREKEMQKNDEELARRLQSEDLLQVMRDESSPAVSPARHSGSSITLITDEQYARSLAQQDIKSSMSQPDLSSQLKKQKLYELYPQADKSFLDEIFSTCGYNLERTVQFLSEVRGPPNPSSRAHSLQSTPERPNSIKRSVKTGSTGNSSSRESTPGRETTPLSSSVPAATSAASVTAATADNDDDQWYDVDDSAVSAISNPSYQDYRAEANLHLQKRTECLQKAAVARRKGMGDVSTYYTRLAEHHRMKSKEADFSAASRIFEDKNRFRDNNEVDLHGLHTHESVALLEQVIQLKRREGKMKYINIITGRGNRSKGGVAKVKQAVVSYLDNRRISYRVENGGGMIRVVL